MNDEDILLWPDGGWCYRYKWPYPTEHAGCTIVKFGSQQHQQLLEQKCTKSSELGQTAPISSL